MAWAARGAPGNRTRTYRTAVQRKTMDEVLAERFAMQIFAMAVDVIEGNLIQSVRCRLLKRGAGLDGGDGRVPGPEHNVVDFPLPSGEPAVRRQRARDVARVVVTFP